MGLATIDSHSQKEHTEIHKIPNLQSVGQRRDCYTFLCKFWCFQMAISQWKLAWLASSLGILWISVSSFWLCESIVANPIIYRLVPRPSRFETRQWTNELLCSLRIRTHTRYCKILPTNWTIIQRIFSTQSEANVHTDMTELFGTGEGGKGFPRILSSFSYHFFPPPFQH